MNVQNVADDFIVSVERIDGLLKLGFTKSEIYTLVAPARTLGRRKDKLNLEESDRVQRLERVTETAVRVLGSEESAEGWLRDKNRALGGQRPIELLVSETGASQIKEILGRIEHGMFS